MELQKQNVGTGFFPSREDRFLVGRPRRCNRPGVSPEFPELSVLVFESSLSFLLVVPVSDFDYWITSLQHFQGTGE
jgi:hypothetical protein